MRGIAVGGGIELVAVELVADIGTLPSPEIPPIARDGLPLGGGGVAK